MNRDQHGPSTRLGNLQRLSVFSVPSVVESAFAVDFDRSFNGAGAHGFMLNRQTRPAGDAPFGPCNALAVSAMIPLQKLQDMFAQMQAQTKWDVDGEMLWEYIGPSP
jgi:hypothetical protein